jgi:hypothetical protein
MFGEDIFGLRGRARHFDLLGYGAVFNAGSASRTPILSEIARFAVDGFQVCVSDQFDV